MPGGARRRRGGRTSCSDRPPPVDDMCDEEAEDDDDNGGEAEDRACRQLGSLVRSIAISCSCRGSLQEHPIGAHHDFANSPQQSLVCQHCFAGNECQQIADWHPQHAALAHPSLELCDVTLLGVCLNWCRSNVSLGNLLLNNVPRMLLVFIREVTICKVREVPCHCSEVAKHERYYVQ
jgi:hypothetical protein